MQDMPPFSFGMIPSSIAYPTTINFRKEVAMGYRALFSKKVLIRLLLSILVTAGLCLLVLGSYSRRLLGKIQYVDPTSTSMLSQDALDRYTEAEDFPESSAPSLQPEEIQFPTQEAQIAADGVINILLIGQDRRPGEERARSDTMILCTLDEREKKLTMTSFLRDLYVSIPGYRSNRINAAYTAGGMALLNQTLESNFGVAIDGNIEVDFHQFPKIIDLLGGVTLELRQDEAEAINVSTQSRLSAGAQLLNGSQALAYSRIRKLDSDGDFSRTNRQRTLLEALLIRYRDAKPSELLQILEELLPMVTTDMPQDKILSLMAEFAPVLPQLEVRTQHIPAEGTYVYRKIRGMSVLVADMDAARALLQETIYSGGKP